MKLPIIRQFYQNQTPENLEKTLEVLEPFKKNWKTEVLKSFLPDLKEFRR